jgi:hypothetical protein
VKEVRLSKVRLGPERHRQQQDGGTCVDPGVTKAERYLLICFLLFRLGLVRQS